MPKKKTTHKSAYYLRAIRDAADFDLQKVMVKARNKLTTIGESEMTMGDEVLRLQRFKVDENQILVHVIRYVPKERAATVRPKSVKVEEVEGTHPPPQGREYKAGDAFLLVRGHRVVFCGHHLTLPAVVRYLARWFKAADLEKVSTGFDVVPVANIDRLKLIREDGVRSIDISAYADAVAVPEHKFKSQILNRLKPIGELISATLKVDKSEAEEKALEDLVVGLRLNLDGNTSASPSAQRAMQELAEATSPRFQ